MAGKQYRIDNEVINAIEDFLDHQDESFYAKGDPSTTASLEDVCGPLCRYIVQGHHGKLMNLSAFPRISFVVF